MKDNEFDDSRYIQNDKLNEIKWNKIPTNTIFFKKYKLMNDYKNI